jgi:hypothetical protein
MIVVLNLVLCLAVIAMVVTPLVRAITRSRPQSAGSQTRRQTAWTSTPAVSRIRTPALSGSDR